MSALEDRRQRALEAAHDARGIADYEPIIEVAIETATRVRITDEAYGLALEAYDHAGRHSIGIRKAIETALRELGFEVEQ